MVLGSAWILGALSLYASFGDAGVASRIGTVRTLGLLALIVVALVHVWEQSKDGRSDLFAPWMAFPAAYVGWFALGSMNLVAPTPGTTLWDPVPVRVLWLALLGLVAYFGGVLPVLRANSSALDREALRAGFRGWMPERIRIAAVGLVGITFLAYGALIAKIGIPILSGDPALARLGIAQHSILFSIFYSGVLALVPLSLAIHWSAAHRTRAQRYLLISFLGSLVLMLFVLGNRGLIIQPALLTLLTAHYLRKPLPFKTLMIAGSAGLVFLSVVGLWRDLKEYGPAHLLTIQAWGFPWWSLPFTYIYTYVRDPVVTFSLSLEVIPKFVGYQYGMILFSPVLAPLPGHQESYDLFFKRILHNDFVGMGRPATLLGSLHADFGVWGIVFGMLAFGALSQWVYRRMQRTGRPFLTMMHVWIAQTALLSLFADLIPYATTLFVPMMMYGLVAFVSPARRDA